MWVADVRRNRETEDMMAPPQGARVGFGACRLPGGGNVEPLLLAMASQAGLRASTRMGSGAWASTFSPHLLSLGALGAAGLAVSPEAGAGAWAGALAAAGLAPEV